MKKSILIFLIFVSGVYSKVDHLSILTYNVENLFDTVHDEGKNDWTYLPAGTPGKEEACMKIDYKRYRDECLNSNWTKTHLKTKIESITKVIKSSSPIIADFIAFSEVENKNALSMVANSLGKSFGVIMADGPDKRGVDVGLIFKLRPGIKFVSKKEHVVDGKYFKLKPTRTILETHFKIDGKDNFYVFVNHWPSQGNPNSTRIKAAEVLKKRIFEILSKNPTAHIVATGDFNVVSKNYPNPIFQNLLVGAPLFDMHTAFKSNKSLKPSVRYRGPVGTYFWRPGMEWNVLDRFILSNNLKDKKGWEVQWDSYQIVSPKFLLTDTIYERERDFHYGSVIKGTPKGYEHSEVDKEKAGFSDHFPIFVRFLKNKPMI